MAAHAAHTFATFAQLSRQLDDDCAQLLAPTQSPAAGRGDLSALSRPVQAIRTSLHDMTNAGGSSSSALRLTKQVVQEMNELNLTMLRRTEESMCSYGYHAPPPSGEASKDEVAVPPSPRRAEPTGEETEALHPPSPPNPSLAVLGISSAGLQAVQGTSSVASTSSRPTASPPIALAATANAAVAAAAADARTATMPVDTPPPPEPLIHFASPTGHATGAPRGRSPARGGDRGDRGDSDQGFGLGSPPPAMVLGQAAAAMAAARRGAAPSAGVPTEPRVAA
jgi:hypothetical protein